MKDSNTYIASNSACKEIENVIEAFWSDVGNEFSMMIRMVIAQTSKLVARLQKNRFHNCVRGHDRKYRITRVSCIAASKLITSLQKI